MNVMHEACNLLEGGTVKGDGAEGLDGVVSGGNLLAAASHPFTSADVGKLLFIGTDGVTRTITGVLGAAAIFAPVCTNGSGLAWLCGTDDGPAINAFIAAHAGHRIFVPRGIYLTSQTIALAYDGTTLDCEVYGSFSFTTPGENANLTVFRWIGPVGGTVVRMQRSTSTVAPYSLCAAGFLGGKIDCSGVAGPGNGAGVGLAMPDAQQCRVEGVKIYRPSSRCLDLTSINPDVSGINSVYHCNFRDLSLIACGSADGIYFGDISHGGGDHACFSKFENVHVTYDSGVAIRMFQTDDMSFENIGISRMAGGTGDAIVLDNGAGGASFGVHFRNLNVTQTDGIAPKILVKAGNRGIYFELGGVDTQIAPTVEAGAECYVMYLGSNAAPGKAYFRSPAINLPNADSSDPKALDWYEEGAFTPSLLINSSATGITYTARAGSFTRIGRVVHAAVDVTVAAKGASVGGVAIDGLPYPPSASLPAKIATLRKTAGWPPSMSGVAVIGQAAPGAPKLVLLKDSASGVIQLSDADLADGVRLQLSIAYEV